MRVFGGDRIKRLMTAMNIPEDMPIESNMVSRAINQAQSKVEGFNFDARKHLLDYDDVLNKQRIAIYTKRREILDRGDHPQYLGALDALWMDHLEGMEALAESVRLRAYGQHDPLVEYRREGSAMFQAMLQNFDTLKKEIEKRIAAQKSGRAVQNPIQELQGAKIQDSGFKIQDKKVGRNDPCPCGS